MKAPLLLEILLRQEPSTQGDLALSSEGVLRYVWESRFGAMLIEVKEGRAFVNGDAIVPVVIDALQKPRVA